MDEQQYNPRLLLETTIESIAGNEQPAAEKVAAVVRPLGLASERLANLKTAVAEAVMNAIEHGNHYQLDKVVTLRVLASQNTISVRVRDQGKGQPMPETIEAPDLEAKLAGFQTPRGWGLFLMKSMVDQLHITSGEGYNEVELLLYR